MKIEKLSPELFTWSRWRKGGDFLLENMIECSNNGLLLRKIKRKIRTLIIGYCDANSLLCRPKKHHKAIMLYNKNHLWFHINNKEFEIIVSKKTLDK
jgi:hypothetical protein